MKTSMFQKRKKYDFKISFNVGTFGLNIVVCVGISVLYSREKIFFKEFIFLEHFFGVGVQV